MGGSGKTGLPWVAYQGTQSVSEDLLETVGLGPGCPLGLGEVLSRDC